MTSTHSVVAGSERVALPGSQLLGRASAHAPVEVTLKLKRKKPLQELTTRPAKAMTREELAEQYGASPEDMKTVEQAFAKYGLQVVEANAATRTVRLAGTAGQMEQAFDVKLFNYGNPNGNYRGRIGAVHVPTEVSNIVEGVFGLDTRRVAHRRRHPIHDAVHARSRKTIPASWWKPSELAARYHFPAGDGSNQTVALFEFGGGYFESDLKEFCRLTGIAVPTVKTVSVDGTSTNARDRAEGEVMLDVEVVAGVCPKANIVVYFADWTEQGWISILDAVMQDSENDPGVVSISWGFAEDASIWTRQAMKQVNQSLLEAAHLGITVCVASGDDGSSDAILDGHAHVDFPSSSPYVLSVGGTTIPSKTTPTPDIVWKEGDGLRDDGGGSTGGGISAVFTRPAWQSGIAIPSVNPGAIEGRIVPDVSANADWNASPYPLFVDGHLQPNGGTSAATPLIAALVALINQKRGAGNRIGYLTPLLYQPLAAGAPSAGAQGCVDVTSGDNNTDAIGGYAASAGYDAVSGWGVPHGVKLLAALNGTVVSAAGAGD